MERESLIGEPLYSRYLRNLLQFQDSHLTLRYDIEASHETFKVTRIFNGLLK